MKTNRLIIRRDDPRLPPSVVIGATLQARYFPARRAAAGTWNFAKL
jgi:hypothetical protein